MEKLDLLFKKYLSANGGDSKAMWFIIKRFEKYIDYVCDKNTDLKHSIIMSLFDLSEDLDNRFATFFNEINR